MFRLHPEFCLIAAGLILVNGIASVSVHGQEKPVSPPRPSYLLPRYDEDWSFLSNPFAPNDFWDPVKFMPLSGDKAVFLSLGGELRETYERFHNTNFGLSPQDLDGYLLQRYLLHVDFHSGSHLRFFGELGSSLENGRTSGPRPVIDENRLDVHQGFFDVLLGEPRSNSSLTIRLGRQEIALGSGRMVALREGANVPLSFDGVRLTGGWTGWRFDGFATRPAQSKPGVFDDLPQHDFAFWGVYAARGLRVGANAPKLDLYYLGLDRKRAVYNQGLGRETRHTVGARLWGQRGAWSYDSELMYQFGVFGSGTINAWRIAADNAYTFSALPWRPRVGLAADVASGDRDPAKANLQTFNGLFQSGSYSGRAQILGPANTLRLEPSVGLTFSEHVVLSAGWGFYWRQNSKDGLYGIGGNLLVPSSGVTDRYEGSRPITQIDWQITRHLSAHLNYIYVLNGRFEEQSVHGTTSLSYVSPWLTYRF